MTPQKETTTSSLEISEDYLGILKNEGDKVWAACVQLNANTDFVNSIPSLVSEDFQSVAYKAEHILMRDLVKVYNQFTASQADPNNIPTKARFILIYFYERLQGKDLSQSYDLKRVNELTKSIQFNKNVRLVQETIFFQPKIDMVAEFAMPSLLFKNKNEQFLSITSFINRIASLIVKADNVVSKEDEELLKQIADKVSNPKITSSQATYNGIPENDTLEIVLAELNELIGLDEIKKNVEDLTNFLKVQKLRQEKGLKTSNNSLHSVFMGPPGTGKTTVARMLGRIFKHLGYLEKGHLVETDRAGMVAGYVGQTAIKSDEIIKTAIDGVLFIDEAYSLASGSFNDFGREAIEILLKRMEDNRNSLVVVIAGYPDEIQMFIQSNPGLQSRFNRYFTFDHFNTDDLLKIFKLIAKKADFTLTKEAEEKLVAILEQLEEKKNRAFGNARAMRNLFEKIIERQANRIVSITPITEEILRTLVEDDIPDVLKTVKEILLFDDEEIEEK